jgi:predicted secreted hydrolase
MRRRSMVLSLLGSALSSPALARAGEEPVALRFPSDFGAHPQSRTEWWYATGSLQAEARLYGFQITFFRTTTGVAADHPSRFAASQLVFAHAALTDLGARRLRHDERIARSGFGVAAAASGDTDVVLRDWTLERAGSVERSRYVAHLTSARAGFAFDLSLQTTQPLLLQGIAGVSQKGPRPTESSRYYSQPQLAVAGSLTLDGKTTPVHGRAWLDHEWSDAFLDPEAVGWDWIGMNLDDGSALTAFRLRRRDGNALYAGGSWRRPGEATRNFGPAEVAFEPGRLWTSPVSKANYPIDWALATPAGRFIVKALQDDQELDSRASTGAIYWEGLSDLFGARGERVGRGYLEMTGYAAPLTL